MNFQLRIMSGSVDIHQQMSLLMSVAYMTTKGQDNVPGLGCAWGHFDVQGL